MAESRILALMRRRWRTASRSRDRRKTSRTPWTLRLTVKLGSMMFVGFGLTIAALRLWT